MRCGRGSGADRAGSGAGVWHDLGGCALQNQGRRALAAVRLAWQRQRRPTPSTLSQIPLLRQAMQAMLDKRYWPEQATGRLDVLCPGQAAMHVSQKTICQSSCVCPAAGCAASWPPACGLGGPCATAAASAAAAGTGSPNAVRSASDPPSPVAGWYPATTSATSDCCRGYQRPRPADRSVTRRETSEVRRSTGTPSRRHRTGDGTAHRPLAARGRRRTGLVRSRLAGASLAHCCGYNDIRTPTMLLWASRHALAARRTGLAPHGFGAARGWRGPGPTTFVARRRPDRGLEGIELGHPHHRRAHQLQRPPECAGQTAHETLRDHDRAEARRCQRAAGRQRRRAERATPGRGCGRRRR
jgi:hypothetical protein